MGTQSVRTREIPTATRVKPLLFRTLLLATVFGATQACIFKPKARLQTTLTSEDEKLIQELGFNPNAERCAVLFCAQNDRDNPKYMAYKYYGAQVFTPQSATSKSSKSSNLSGIIFRFKAPAAKAVYLYTKGGDTWTRTAELERGRELEPGIDGVWATFLSSEKGGVDGLGYKYLVVPKDDKAFFRTDPYSHEISDEGFGVNPLIADPQKKTQRRAENANAGYKVNTYYSVARDLEYTWSEEGMKNRTQIPLDHLRIYEIHPSNFRPVKEENGVADWPTWKEIGEEVERVARVYKYNAVEFMPLAHHNLDKSYGYQVQSFFATNYRHGSPKELKRMIDNLHQKGIAVIFDLVHSHAGTDANPDPSAGETLKQVDTLTALNNIDGSPSPYFLKGYMGFNQSWKTHIFDYSTPETEEYLKSNAIYWIDQFKTDGYRVDAVEYMTKLNQDRGDIWTSEGIKGARQFRGNGEPSPNAPKDVNGAGVDYLRWLTSFSKKFAEKTQKAPFINIAESIFWPSSMTANDNPADPRLENPEGLGFDYQWRIGLKNETNDWMKKSPQDGAPWNMYRLLYPIQWGGKYINYINSHDEVISGKTYYNGLLGAKDEKVRGQISMNYVQNATEEEKVNFAFSMGRNLEALVHFLYPGMPMGWRFTERGATGYWFYVLFEPMLHQGLNHEGPRHDAFGKYMEEVGTVYYQHPFFADTRHDSSQTVLLDESEFGTTASGAPRINRMLVQARTDKDGLPIALIVSNMSEHHYDRYPVLLRMEDTKSLNKEKNPTWKLVLNSDASAFGGRGTLTYFGEGEYTLEKSNTVKVDDIFKHTAFSDEQFIKNWPKGSPRGGGSDEWADFCSNKDYATFCSKTYKINGEFFKGRDNVAAFWIRELPPFTTLVFVRGDYSRAEKK